jgi:methionyl aminopeptidase
MIVRNNEDLSGLMRIGQICGLTLQHMLAHVQPGISTKELDNIGAEFLKRHNAVSAPITAYKYPGWTCISINDEAAHGIPSSRVIQAGDMVNIDVSAVLENYWGDTGASIVVPPIKPEYERLCGFTIEALYAGIKQARANQPLNAIGKAIQGVAQKGGYRLIRELGGHGVGRHIHEKPNVPNHFNPRARTALTEGMVITIEPFLNLGRGHIITDRDGWTLRTPDKSISAQYEHTVIIAGDEPILITKVDGGH